MFRHAVKKAQGKTRDGIVVFTVEIHADRFLEVA